MIEMFACFPLSSRMTREACARRHRTSKRQERKGGLKKGESYLVGHRTCAECAVGELHARGEEPWTWPDGAPIQTSAMPEPGTSRWLGGADTPPRSEERPDRDPHVPPPEGGRGAPRDADPAPRSEEPADPTPTRPPRRRSVGSSGRGTATAKEAPVGSVITKKARKCVTCGEKYKPRGNRQKYCDDCKPKKKRSRAKPKAKPTPVLEELDRRFTAPTDEEIAEDVAPAPAEGPGPVRAYLARRIAQAERELAAMRAALEAYDAARGA